MARRFRQHDLRQVTPLDGIWDFAFLGDVDADTVDINNIDFNDRMAVPGCFDATPGYAGRRGLVAYRRTILLSDDVPHRLVFDSVSHWCRVFVGGRAIGEHPSSFVRFACDVVDQPPGQADLVVLVDNRLDHERHPLYLDYDWYHYGGISRPVELHRLGSHWIDSLSVVTTPPPQ